MALIKCPECGKEISDKAVSCPNCGYPLEIYSKESEKIPVQKSISKHCQNCGKQVPFYQTKCPNCGEKVNPELPISTTMKTWRVGPDKIEVKCQCCGKIYLYEKKWFYPADDPRGQIPNTLLRCPGCHAESPAGTRLPNEGTTEYGKNSAEKQSRCPYCGSHSIQAVKKGFGLGKAAAGGLLLGPVGLFGGVIGSNKIQRVCLNCGKKF